MSNSCHEIRELTRDRVFEEVMLDRALRPAIERHLSIIGEALYCAAKQKPNLDERISSFPKIIALRHRLIHGYFSTSVEILWRIVTHDIATLQSEIEILLQEDS
ncbi:MAG: DUF86 domain-containing protein [Candidatus Hydrogenedentes bacterium]|nr:DUF86 domain-containing protein [Candidatus Hydrogenedentota bacterium]